MHFIQYISDIWVMHLEEEIYKKILNNSFRVN